MAYQACSIEMPVTVAAMAKYLNKSERCIRDRLKELKDTYWVNQGTVGMYENKEKTEN